MKSPSISVVMAAFNAEAYIAEAIESILKQTHTDFEFIIINDGSKDKTLSIIKSFSDKRIVIIDNDRNYGLAISLNKGIKIANGKYIARMDADDISSPNRLEKQFNFLENNLDFDVCVTPMKLFGSESSISGDGLNSDEEIKAELIWGTPTNHATMLMLTEKIRTCNLYYDETFGVGQDWKFWFDVRDHVKIYSLNDLLYFYRRGDHNVTVQFKHKTSQRSIRMHDLLMRDLGISFTPQDLLLHQFIYGLFAIEPSPKTVKSAWSWYSKLLKQNRLILKYDVVSFEASAARKWHRLFFLITPYGFKTVFAYFISSGVTWGQFSYYFKYRINSLFGRNKIK
jgi:glycosyltransferase involved in cell wall biosynthesis